MATEDKNKKKSIDDMLQSAAIEKFGLKPVMDKIEKVMPLLEQVAAGSEVLKGQDGKTPELGVDYLTPEQQQSALEMIRPKKGVDYQDGNPGTDGYTPIKGLDYFTDDEVAEVTRNATPVKGRDYYTAEEAADFKKQATPVKGVDYKDGENPTPAQFIEVVKALKGKDAAAFSQIVGSKIDISHVRNAGSFIFNGKKYGVEELMHGGGSGGGGTPGGNQFDVQLNNGVGGFSGSDNLNFQSGYLTINGDSGYGQLQWLNSPVSSGYGGAGINGTATPIIVGAANGDLSIWSSQAMNFSADAGATNMLQINANGTVDIGSLASLGSQFVIADLNGELSSKALLVDGVTITGDGINTPLTASSSGGTVTSVSGTTNRITSTGGTTPVIDISASYVGQSSITTLGTIGTGVWAGTAVAIAHGGTGVTTIAAKSIWLANSADTITSVTPGAGQSIRINAGNTAWEAYTPSTGTVTAVSIASANGFAGSSSGGATPALTISTSITGVLQGNGTAISAATTTGSGSVVLATSPTLTTASLGSSTATTQTPADNSTKVATTAYVDAAVLGQNFKEAAKYATTAALATVVYANGSSGVGATLTAVGVGALSLDGATPSVNDRILVKNQVSTFQNGIYTVTVVGTGATVFVLTRAVDANQSSEYKTGDSLFVTSGTANSSTTWAYTGIDSLVMGTDAITYVQTAGQGSFTQGAGITITGNSIALTAPVSVALGGTNATSASITAFNNITGYTASGATGTTSTNLVFSTSPTLITPTLGAATATTINGNTFTTGTYTLTGTAGKTLNFTNTLTLAGTDSTTMTFPSTTATIARTDAAQTFTGTQTFAQVITTANAITATSNAATVPVTSRHNIVTNNSAATLTITLTTTSAVNMQTVVVQILDSSAAAQTITWVNTENSTVTAPVTSNGSTTLPLTVGFMYNSATSKWRCIASA